MSTKNKQQARATYGRLMCWDDRDLPQRRVTDSAREQLHLCWSDELQLERFLVDILDYHGRGFTPKVWGLASIETIICAKD